ncbi:uncharacterized protein LOC128559003 isoform X2 [Mercenaria mercenaria]|uniref:uncharacterized protein LOC128559003 isoform X2 n=1 Tax=Mercenaria mercenaria TaxID=6596 RepID=UPI00234E5DF6|nr:uncharacterized protein LOC128559003 isoform X2 [Mercenaria mercenaria]
MCSLEFIDCDVAMWKFIIFLFNIIVAFICCNASTVSLKIVPEKANILLAAGDVLKLDCVHVYNGEVTDVATFSKGGQIIPMSNDKGFTILVKIHPNSENVTRTTTLKKMESKVSDTGKYSCDVEDKSADIMVNVIQVTPVDAILPVQSPDALELRCNTNGMTADSNDVRWIWTYKDTILRNNEKFKMVNKNNNGILQIKNPNRTNMGKYLCSLTQKNDVKIQKPRSVFLRASPAIESFTMEAYHTDLELKCVASGSPIPNIIWTKNGSKLNITNYSHAIEEQNTVNSSVVLQNVNQHDDGVYSCIAYNDIEPYNDTAQKVINPRAYAVAVNHHPGTGTGGTGDHTHHHPHPDGNTHCAQNSDCGSCNDATLTAVCVAGVCKCENTTTGKRQNSCHSNHQCDGGCPAGQNGVCNNGHCECGDHGKRAACHSNHQCDGGCPVGQNGVCNNGHCECGDHGKRAAKRATCHGGGSCPTCPDGSKGVCNSHGHCDCGDNAAVGKRQNTCHSNHQCDGGCPAGQNGVCNHGHCECGDHGKREA